jgi:hypothetical protein
MAVMQNCRSMPPLRSDGAVRRVVERIESRFRRQNGSQSADPRTCWNKFSNVMSFLKANGISKLVKKNDWPQFVEEEPEIYEQDELDQLFGACDEEELVWFSFYLMTGEREQEVQNSYWTDINLKANTVALHAKRPRHRLTALHQLFWVVLRRLWAGWKEPLVLVTPRTVVGWHRAGFRLYWKWLSRTGQRGGRKRVSKEIRALIFRMVAENPTWGAPRVHGELLKLGFDLSETTVSRWLRRVPRTPDPAKHWLTFLRNHREAGWGCAGGMESHRGCSQYPDLAR